MRRERTSERLDKTRLQAETRPAVVSEESPSGSLHAAEWTARRRSRRGGFRKVRVANMAGVRQSWSSSGRPECQW